MRLPDKTRGIESYTDVNSYSICHVRTNRSLILKCKTRPIFHTVVLKCPGSEVSWVRSVGVMSVDYSLLQFVIRSSVASAVYQGTPSYEARDSQNVHIYGCMLNKHPVGRETQLACKWVFTLTISTDDSDP